MVLSLVFPEGRKKALTFSYDDGNKSDLRLADIFDATGMKCTFNVNGAGVGKPNKLDADDLKQLIRDGHEIACHGLSHPFEDQLAGMSLLEDVIEDRRLLEAATGTIISGMAYPFGAPPENERAVAALRAAGIKYCRTTKPQETGLRYIPENWLMWNPTTHHSGEIMRIGKSLIENPWGTQMMYVWGHAFEFERANNWNVMEEFCDFMKNRPEIWYATNMQIHDYVEAFRHLESSMDTRLVYNPGAVPVWISAGSDRKILEIAPGATVQITQS